MIYIYVYPLIYIPEYWTKMIKNIKKVGNCTLNVTNEVRLYSNLSYKYSDFGVIAVAYSF